MGWVGRDFWMSYGINLMSYYAPHRYFGERPYLRSTSASTSLMKVANWDGKSRDIGQVLTAAFDANEYLDCIKNLRALDIDPLSYINNLDMVSS